MPPGGLYRIPSHHLYGARMPRPSFNSQNFADEQSVRVVDAHSLNQLDDAVEPRTEGKEKHGKKKTKKKHSLNNDEHKDENGVDGAAPQPDDVKLKRKKDRKKESREHVDHQSFKKKKRKRESAVDGNGAATTANDTGYASTIKGDNEATEDLAPTETPLFSKRAKKSSRKSKKASAQSVNTPVPVPISISRPVKAPVPLPEINMVPLKTPVPVPMLKSTPNDTPIPFPQVANPSTRSSQAQTVLNGNAVHGEILVPETPPSKLMKNFNSSEKLPISLPPSHDSLGQEAGRKLSKKQRISALLSVNSQLAGEGTHLPTVLSASANPVKPVPIPSVPIALTDANLEKFYPPLKGLPKPKTPASSAFSASQPKSSSSAMSIKEAFARVANKPYTRSGAGVDPFAALEAKKKKYEDTHYEATWDIFKEDFEKVQVDVNFTHEQGYLDEYLERSQARQAVPAPCLGGVTGCNPKKEELLRQSREERIVVVQSPDARRKQEELSNAALRTRTAEFLLKHSIRARIPVPIGQLEGSWTLYCPRYFEAHFDKYGLGQRVLRIATCSGFIHENAYTARLSLPPRPMPYSILAFTPPPHASFRSTILKTSAEGYTMEAIFLGNGYLLLRLDLNLLLRGKPTEVVHGKKVHMEFIGINDQAVQWEEKKDELEEVGRKLFQKYGHIHD